MGGIQFLVQQGPNLTTLAHEMRDGHVMREAQTFAIWEARTKWGTRADALAMVGCTARSRQMSIGERESGSAEVTTVTPRAFWGKALFTTRADCRPVGGSRRGCAQRQFRPRQAEGDCECAVGQGAKQKVCQICTCNPLVTREGGPLGTRSRSGRRGTRFAEGFAV
jgi:hypothetical protein